MSWDRADKQNSLWWWRWLQNTPPLVRSLVLIIIYIIVALALEEIAYIFRSSDRVQPWDPAAGWNVVFLFGFGLRYGLAIPLVSIIENTLLRPSETLIQGLINGTYIATFATGCCALLLYKLDIDPRLKQLSYVVKFAVVSILGALTYAVTDITTLLALGKIEQAEWFNKIMHEWAGEATGIAMLAPPLLILLRNFPWKNKRLDLKGAAPKINFNLPQFKDTKEWLGLLIITFFFTWLAHGGIKSESLEYTYFTFIPLVWVCAWKGFELTTIITLAINITAVVLVGKSIRYTGDFALQFGLMTATYVGLLLSAFVTARSEENTRRKDLEQQLRYDATHDSLTGLYNRAWFVNRLEQTINKKNENDNFFAVLFLDLDRFKNVNDNLGHITGDKLLIEIAQQLQKSLPENAHIARLGGDEFTILLEEISDVSQASQVAEVICQHLDRSYRIEDYEVFTTVSVGVAYSRNNSNLKALDLLRNADIALYEAKNRGKSQYVIFDSQMYNQVFEKAQLEQDLRTAIDEL